jgi:hypothetical protein
MTGYLCDLVVKGKIIITPTELPVIYADTAWVQGSTFFLTAAGQMTAVPPDLQVSLGSSLAPTPLGDYNFLVDIGNTGDLEHEHVRDNPDWNTIDGSYTLSKEPSSPEAVFLEIDYY